MMEFRRQNTIQREMILRFSVLEVLVRLFVELGVQPVYNCVYPVNQALMRFVRLLAKLSTNEELLDELYVLQPSCRVWLVDAEQMLLIIDFWIQMKLTKIILVNLELESSREAILTNCCLSLLREHDLWIDAKTKLSGMTAMQTATDTQSHQWFGRFSTTALGRPPLRRKLLKLWRVQVH